MFWGIRLAVMYNSKRTQQQSVDPDLVPPETNCKAGTRMSYREMLQVRESM